MSVIFQYAGKALPGKTDDVKALFSDISPLVQPLPGFEKCRLLLNHNTLQVQMLFYWDSFEHGLAFNQEAFPRLAVPLGKLLEASGTLITSILEAHAEV